ncbi:MAG: hypothetical protein HPY84_12095 [Syntrophobacteraceae bacterium]|jgi:hypothetical protein|nr:hypothetical protein [Syntrophobacteraceae bacterium]
MKAFLIFSHHLTEKQHEDLRLNWKITDLVPLPSQLQDLWSNIPAQIELIEAYIEPVTEWLSSGSSPGDLALIQGDSGATCILVQAAYRFGLVPVYSTTERIVRERRSVDGKVYQERVFEHVRFRIYGR